MEHSSSVAWYFASYFLGCCQVKLLANYATLSSSAFSNWSSCFAVSRFLSPVQMDPSFRGHGALERSQDSFTADPNDKRFATVEKPSLRGDCSVGMQQHCPHCWGQRCA